MDWIMNLPPESLIGLLTDPKKTLNDVENAVRDAIEAVHSPDEIKILIAAARLDMGMSTKQSVAVARINKI